MARIATTVVHAALNRSAVRIQNEGDKRKKCEEGKR